MNMRGFALVLPVLALVTGAFGATGAFAQAPSLEADQQEAAAAGDAEAGQKTFNQCKACHTVEAGKNRVGPSLYGVVGNEAGAVEGFKYSKAMQESGITWTPENLDKYLADPKGFMPGNKMAFAGLKSAEDRANVIAFMQQHGEEGSEAGSK